MPLVEFSPLEEPRGQEVERFDQLAGRGEDRDMVDLRGNEDNLDERTIEFLPVGTLRTQYIDYLDTKVDEIEEQKDARRYYHGAQLTAEQRRILLARHQPPQIWNRVSRKINSIVGIVQRVRSDPKAQARSPKSEQGAEIATQSVRYCLDTNEFKSIEYQCLLQCAVDGIGGVQMVLTQGDKGDPDIALPFVIGDEYFYDPKSYRLDFADARYEGLAKWLDLDAAIELFPNKADLLESLLQGDTDMTTNPDRELKWVLTAGKRLRLVEHWYKHKGLWKWAFYCANTLIEQGVSPFIDDRGKSDRSFLTFRALVDHDGDSYGFVRGLKDQQDALNQGKSKTLHLANSRRVISEKGAVDDVEIARREWARPDGWIEKNPQKEMKPDDTKPDLAAFETFTQDAKAEIDGFANTNLAAISGVGLSQLSGRAVELLRQPGMAELGPFILAQRAWKLRLYRKIWNAEQRHWTAERWIRVNNNEGLQQFIQLNGVDLDQWGRPMLVNGIGALDVDILLEEGPDVTSLMRETFDVLKGYPPGTFPPQVLIELSDLPRSDKTRVLQMLQPKPNPMQQAAAKGQIEAMFAKNAKTAAETRRTLAQAEQANAAAMEKRAKSVTEGARAGHIAQAAHLDAAEFVRDSLIEAHNINRDLQKFLQPQQPPAQRQF